LSQLGASRSLLGVLALAALALLGGAAYLYLNPPGGGNRDRHHNHNGHNGRSLFLYRAFPLSLHHRGYLNLSDSIHTAADHIAALHHRGHLDRDPRSLVESP